MTACSLLRLLLPTIAYLIAEKQCQLKLLTTKDKCNHAVMNETNIYKHKTWLEQNVLGENYNVCISRVLQEYFMNHPYSWWSSRNYGLLNLRAFVHNLNLSRTKTKYLALSIEIICSPKWILAFLKKIFCRLKTLDEVSRSPHEDFQLH